MTSIVTTSLISAEWSTAFKVALIAVVSVILIAVVAWLVLEAVGKDVTPSVQADNADSAREVKPAPEDAKPELDKARVQSEPEPQKTEVAATVAPPVDEDAEGISSKAEAIELTDGAVLVDDDGDIEGGVMIFGKKYLNVRYNRSFTAKLIQADDTLKGYYNELGNELFAYKYKSRVSWSNDTWYSGRSTIAKFAIRGKTLSMYLALDPKEFEGTAYTFRDVSGVAKYKSTPMWIKVKSDRALRRAKELIAIAAGKKGKKRDDIPKVNLRTDYRDTATLVREKYIKLYYVASPDMSKQELEQAAAADIKAKDRTPRDFSTKLMHSAYETKQRYSAVKNELLRYGMKPRISNSFESWYRGRTTFAKFAIRGKTLTLYLALDPAEFEGTKYNFRNVGEVGKYESVPMRVNLKSDRSVRWVKELIATLAEKNAWEREDLAEDDFRYVKKTKKK